MIALCKVRSFFFLNILWQPIAAFGGKQKSLIFPRILHILDHHLPFSDSTFWGVPVAHGCRRCPVRKHHVSQWFSQAPLADPHFRRMDRHSAAVWWKAGNVDFTKDFTRFGPPLPFLHSALSGQTVKSSRFSIVFERFCCGPWGHADLVERVLPT